MIAISMTEMANTVGSGVVYGIQDTSAMKEKGKTMRLIDADLLFDKLEQRYSRSSGWAHKAFGTAIDDVADSPTVDAVEVVHGRWANNKNDYPECDKCGYMPMYDHMIDDIWYSPYCPNCGAKMVGEMIECESFDICPYRIPLNYCPMHCSKFRHKDDVRVVRCKECKHYNLYRLECHNGHMNGRIGIDGFCSYGERK